MRLIVLLLILSLLNTVYGVLPHFSTYPYPKPVYDFFNDRDWLCYNNHFGLIVSNDQDIDCCISNGYYASTQENECCYNTNSFCDSNGCCVNGVWHEGYISYECGSDSDCTYSYCGNGVRYYETCNLGRCVGHSECDTSCGTFCCSDGEHYILLKISEYRYYTIPLDCITFNGKNYGVYERTIFDYAIPCSTTIYLVSTDVCSCNWLCSLQTKSISHAHYQSGCSCSHDLFTCYGNFNHYAIYACDTGYYDCNNDVSDSCESTRSSISKYCTVTCGYDGSSWTILDSDCIAKKDASVCDIGEVV